MNEFKLSGFVNYPKEVSDKMTVLKLSFRNKKDEPARSVNAKLVGKAKKTFDNFKIDASDIIEIKGFISTSSYVKDEKKITSVDFVATEITDFKTKAMMESYKPKEKEERQEELAF